MAVQYDIPKEWFRQYKQIHGWRKNSVPLTNEQIAESEDEDVIDVALAQARRHSITQEIHKREQKILLKDANKFRELDVTLLEHMREIVGAPAEVPRLEINETNDPYALVICPTDFHWGKGGWVDEVGETYNFEEARIRLFTKTNALINKLSSNPEKIYIGIGSDWFHVDNDVGQTTKGTAQDMAATPAQILMEGCDLARQHIDLLRTVSDVELVFMGGNHDRHTSIMLMLYLEAYYNSCDDVTVTVSPHVRQYVTYGNNLIGFTHGDGKVMNKLHSLMAHEARRDWGVTTNHLWFHGHLHHQQIREVGGCLVVQLPSLAGEDRYHSRNGYVMARPGLSAYMIDKNLGLTGSLFAPVVHDE
jgi:predicted phosphodiesterase